MGDLGLNKIAGAVLATSLGLIGLHNVSNIVFAEGGDSHHGDDHGEHKTMSEQMCSKFAYCIDIADGGHGGEVVEEVFDLGLLLASADASRGERVFKGQCSTCHTIDAGGANGTGPNLHDIVGAGKAAKAGFGYSAALSGIGGDWTYEELNAWLENPASYARGTSMSFAGLRKDPDRMNLIAYLAANTTSAPAYPDPLPAAVEEAIEETVEDAVTDAVDDAVEEAVTDAVEEAVDEAVETAVDEAVTETIEEAVDEAVDEAVEDAVETIEEIISEDVPVEAPAEPEHH